MPHKITKLSLLIFIFLLFFNRVVYPYDNRYVHQNINENAALQSTQLYSALKTLGFRGNAAKDILENNIVYGQKIKFWFHEGANLEDETDCRSKFHFHDPTKSWDTAGLSSIVIDTFCLDDTHRSSLVWAQDTGNLWTWQKARQHYHDALTNPDRNMREQNLAYTFRSLGQVMHLISDASVPAHARNDIHIFPYTVPGIGLEIGDPTFESWTRDNYKSLNYTGTVVNETIFDQAVFHSSAPIAISALWDQDKYTGSNPPVTTESIIGLAEYSNANFFSEDTIFGDYSYPGWSSVEEYDEIIDLTTGKSRTYLRKVKDGEKIDHLATGKWFYKYLPSAFKSSGLKLDEQVYKDYASLLIPRGVGYSAGLLNYFFRGSIDISLPPTGVYAQTNDPNQGFTRVTLLAKNTTPNNEEMNDGSVELVVKYRLALEDPFKNYPGDYDFQAEPQFSYVVVPEANGVRSIPRDSPAELIFDLSHNPIPLYAIDVYLQLVYRGRLGSEGDAVAVGSKDISEPTPVDLINDMDRTCLNGSFYVAGTPEAIAQVDTNHNGIAAEWDVYSHNLNDIYFRISSISDPKYVSTTDYNFATPFLAAGDFARALYILTDYNFIYDSIQRPVSTDSNDPWYHLSWTSSLYSGRAIKNQTDYIEDAAVCAPLSAPCYIWWYPTFSSYRDRETWWGAGIIFINESYPQDSDCSCYRGIVSTCPKGIEALRTTDALSKDRLRQGRMDTQMQPVIGRQRRNAGR